LVDEPVRSEMQAVISVWAATDVFAVVTVVISVVWVGCGEVLDEPPAFEHVGHQPVKVG